MGFKPHTGEVPTDDHEHLAFVTGGKYFSRHSVSVYVLNNKVYTHTRHTIAVAYRHHCSHSFQSVTND